MKEIELTQGQATKVDDDLYDYLMQWVWYAQKYRNRTWYAERHTRKGEIFRHRRIVRMHRVVLAYRKFGVNFTEAQYDSMELGDHRFHDTLDNRSSQLRECTQRENLCNRKNSGSSEYPGVRKKRNGRCEVRVTPCSGRQTCYVGSFIDEHQAGCVAVAAREYVVNNRIMDHEPIKQWARDRGYRI